MEPQKYTKKPVTIEAVQFTAFDEINEAEGGVFPWLDSQDVDYDYDYFESQIVIGTLEGKMRASVGDWIIKGLQGEFYPCKPDIFEQTYSKGDAGELSYGHHTFRELYEYRMLYNAHAALGWLDAGIPVVKSWRHSDGEECFGGGWFVISAHFATGQVTNHYRAEHWDMFHVPAVDLAPEYDGHTPAEAARRLAEYLGGDA